MDDIQDVLNSLNKYVFACPNSSFLFVRRGIYMHVQIPRFWAWGAQAMKVIEVISICHYSGTPPYDHPVYKTTSLLWPYSFKPNVTTIESFYYFEDPVNATTSLLRPGFYGPTVVALTGFHCIMQHYKQTHLWSKNHGSEASPGLQCTAWMGSKQNFFSLSTRCCTYLILLFIQNTCIIHHNQILMTKFGKNFCLTRKCRQNCSILTG